MAAALEMDVHEYPNVLFASPSSPFDPARQLRAKYLERDPK